MVTQVERVCSMHGNVFPESIILCYEYDRRAAIQAVSQRRGRQISAAHKRQARPLIYRVGNPLSAF